MTNTLKCCVRMCVCVCVCSSPILQSVRLYRENNTPSSLVPFRQTYDDHDDMCMNRSLAVLKLQVCVCVCECVCVCVCACACEKTWLRERDRVITSMRVCVCVCVCDAHYQTLRQQLSMWCCDSHCSFSSLQLGSSRREERCFTPEYPAVFQLSCRSLMCEGFDLSADARALKPSSPILQSDRL